MYCKWCVCVLRVLQVPRDGRWTFCYRQEVVLGARRIRHGSGDLGRRTVRDLLQGKSDEILNAHVLLVWRGYLGEFTPLDNHNFACCHCIRVTHVFIIRHVECNHPVLCPSHLCFWSCTRHLTVSFWSDQICFNIFYRRPFRSWGLLTARTSSS